MTIVTNRLQIVYGTITIGGSNQNYIPNSNNGQWSLTKDYSTATFSFNVVVLGSSEADLNTKATALEAEFRTPKLDLTVTIDSNTFISWAHASEVGLNAVPTIEKIDSPVSSQRSREYNCSVSVTLGS